MKYLVFQLYGPMASWGDIAVGESRHSHQSPTKTAIMGLIAAALGIKRDEESLHQRLNTQYSMAVSVISRGNLLRDYHTAQAPDSVGKFQYRTRRDELITGKERLGTVLSSREYRTEFQLLIALTAQADAPYSLEQLNEALNSPKFMLYLGRKSCPLAAPTAGQVVEANGYLAAFSSYSASGLFHAKGEYSSDFEARCLPVRDLPEYFWEGCPDDLGKNVEQSEIISFTRHDKLLSRGRWQFAPKTVYRWQPTEGV